MKNHNILRVAITGPESTGKSTLAKQLAEHYKTVWVPEFARTYIDQLSRSYTQKDLFEIAVGQINEEDGLANKANTLLFCDTELLVIKIWSDYKYGFVDPALLTQIKQRRYELYLLMDVDLEWEYDPQREHADKRVYFFNLFKNELENIGANYHIVNGSSEARLRNAINAVDALLSQH